MKREVTISNSNNVQIETENYEVIHVEIYKYNKITHTLNAVQRYLRAIGAMTKYFKTRVEEKNSLEVQINILTNMEGKLYVQSQSRQARNNTINTITNIPKIISRNRSTKNIIFQKNIKPSKNNK